MRVAVALVAFSALSCHAQLPFSNAAGQPAVNGQFAINGTNVQVTTRLGTVVGNQIVSLLGNQYFRFVGIPYAEAPVGQLRFMDPVPKAPWTTPLDATNYGPMCLQVSPLPVPQVVGNEDCLRLNVYTPLLPEQVVGQVPLQSTLLPVMVYIHGGAFVTGSGVLTPEAIMSKQVVVVSMNYRLGALGFLTLGNPALAGNMGLKDQLEALRWIQGNIMAFGGDPTKVTIFGNSAGGISAHLHMLSPQGAGLYRAVIAQSGTALISSEKLRKRTSVAQGARLLALVGCSQPDTRLAVQCLQSVNASLVVAATTISQLEPQLALEKDLNGNGTFEFFPSIDDFSINPFLPDHPLVTLSLGRQKDIPLITGVASGDGALFLSPLWNDLDWLTANFSLYAPKVMFDSTPFQITPVEAIKANATRHFYVPTGIFAQVQQQEMIDMITDIGFLSPAYFSALLHSRTQRSPVFFYELTQKPSVSFNQFYGALSGASGQDFGPVHSDELMFLFTETQGFGITSPTQTDQQMTNTMVTMWTDFAKHGEPVPFKAGVASAAWLPFAEVSENYLDIQLVPQNVSGVYRDRMFFWSRIFWQDEERLVISRQTQQPQSFGGPQLGSRPQTGQNFGFGVNSLNANSFGSNVLGANTLGQSSLGPNGISNNNFGSSNFGSGSLGANGLGNSNLGGNSLGGNGPNPNAFGSNSFSPNSFSSNSFGNFNPNGFGASNPGSFSPNGFSSNNPGSFNPNSLNSNNFGSNSLGSNGIGSNNFGSQSSQFPFGFNSNLQQQQQALGSNAAFG